MKHLVWALLLLVLDAPGLRLAVAAPPVSDDDPTRKIPPIRISIASLYQRWTQNGATLRELSFPITAQVALRPNLGVSVGVSQASAEGDGFERVEGLTDVQLDIAYRVTSKQARLSFNLGLNMPTGKSRLTDAAYETAFQLGFDQYNFSVPHFGQGTTVAPGIALAVSVTNRLVLGVGASYHLRGSFEPISTLPDKYDWGDELLVTLGAEWQLARTLSFSADVRFTRYEADRIGDVEVYDAGNRVSARAQLHKILGRHDLWFSARYRNVETNRVITAGALRAEAVRATPGLVELSGAFGMHLGPALRATLHVEGTRYEATFAFEQLDVYGIGMAAEISPLPAVTIPLQVTYSLGDLEGLEAGVGIATIF